MNISVRKISWTKSSGIILIVMCLSAILLKYLVEPYRGTWIYQYGNMISLYLFYGGTICSLVNSIFLVLKHKSEIRNNLIWILLSAIPFLYIAIMISIAVLADYELERNF